MMVNSSCENNFATISGTVAEEPVLSHELFGEGFYIFYINVKRLSDSYDKIPVMISDRLADVKSLTKGTYVFAEGQFRSYNQTEGDRSKLMLMVFARDFYKGARNVATENDSEGLSSYDVGLIIKEIPEDDKNLVTLDGFLCKKPIYRKTPLKREISDIILAVNRAYNKSDYVPCISWGRNARFSQNLQVGDRVKVTGRIQSRMYQKKLPDGTAVDKIAYEVSVTRIEKAEAEQTENQ